MILQTDRLLLRPFAETDAEAVYDYARDPRVGPAAGWKPHSSVADSLRMIRAALFATAVFAVADRATGRVIGSAGFLTQPGQPPSDEIGFSLHADWWGRGLGTEVCRRLVQFGFRDLDLSQIFAICYAENSRCRRVLEKCGFCRAFDEQVLESGEERTVIFYCLYRGDWERGTCGDGN